MQFANSRPGAGDHGPLGRLFLHTQKKPDALAFAFLPEDRPAEHVTYAELLRRVTSLAGALRQRAAEGERAVLAYSPGLRFVEAFLACLLARVVAVPTCLPQRSRKNQRFHSILAGSRPGLLLTETRVAADMDRELRSSASSASLLVTDDAALPSADAASPMPVAEDVAFLQYSSGSTSAPRGVVVTHDNLLANTLQIQQAFAITPEDVFVHWLPLFHDMGLVGCIVQPLVLGAASVLLSPTAFARKPIRWLRAAQQYGGTLLGGPNSAYEHCTRFISDEEKRGLDLTGVRVAYVGAEPVHASTLNRFAAAFASCGFPAKAFFPCYGLAESTLFVSGGPPRRGARVVSLKRSDLEQGRVSLVEAEHPDACPVVTGGRVAGGTSVAIVDPCTCAECDPGVVGEIWVSSPSVARGYWEDPEQSGSTFGARTLAGRGPFLRTGDLGFVCNGDLCITGRIKDLMIIGGRNIYPQDVEALVQDTIGGLAPASCAAFTLPGEEEEGLVLAVEADRALYRAAQSLQGTSPGAAAPLLADLVKRVNGIVNAEFGVCLRALLVVRPGRFPRTTSGKIQRNACRSAWLDRTLEVAYRWPAQPGGDPTE
jgi:acyl-CoA synthetase (AMP-forming)/AMP-acid ligase II